MSKLSRTQTEGKQSSEDDFFKIEILYDISYDLFIKYVFILTSYVLFSYPFYTHTVGFISFPITYVYIYTLFTILRMSIIEARTVFKS